MVLFLTPEVLAQKDLAKAFEFLRCKDEVGPKPVLVTIGSSDKKGENVSPNSEAVQVLSAHVKRLYKLDVRDCFVAFDSSKMEQSVAVLRSHVEQQCVLHYQTQAAEVKKILKSLKRSAKLADVFAFVRGCFVAGLFAEFQRNPLEALACYRDGFEQLKAAMQPQSLDDEVEQMATALSMLCFKMWTLYERMQQTAEIKKHFREAIRLLRKWVKREDQSELAIWAHEWAARINVIAGELLTAPNNDLQLNAFYYYAEAAQCLKSARALSQRFRSPIATSVAQYESRVTAVLTKAYAETRTLPIAMKRAKMHIAVLLAEEASRAGRHEDVLQLCQRISSPKSETMSRYKSESWWSLLGVVDALAASSAKNLGQTVVAVNHALRCLSPAARASHETKTQMMELVLELRNHVSEQVDWFMNENVMDALIAVELKFERESACLGSLVAGSVSLCSHLPMVVSFDNFVITMSRSNLKPYIEKDLFPLLLRPNETCVLPFACRAPTTTLCSVSVQSACLCLGRILLIRDFELSSKKPAFLSVKEEAPVVAVAAPPTVSAPVAVARSSSAALAPSSRLSSTSRRLTVESGSGIVDCYGAHLNASEICPALETLRGGLAVRGLELGCNNLGSEGAGLIGSWLSGGAAPQLGSLSLWNCGLGPQSGSHIATILRSCPGLRVLNLGLNRISDGGIACFARSLQIASALEELVLWRVSMSKAGLIVLAENLLPPSRLRILDVRSNELGEGSEGALANFLYRNTALQQIFIDDNPGLSNPQALKDLSVAIASTNFSLQCFGEGVESKPLLDIAKRNKEVGEMLRNGSLSLPFKALSEVPSILLQSTGAGRRITHLDLSHNQIQTLPSELGQLEHLVQCVLSHNCLSELPVEFCKLRNLTFIDVSHNSISYIPTEFGLLARLTQFLAGNNSLQSIVPELFNGAAPICHTLRELDLSFNHLVALPGTLANLRALQTLHLNNNQIAEIGSGFSKFLASGLTMCNLSHNALQTLPPPFCEHKKMLNIAHNPFVQLPQEVVGRGANAVWEYLEDMLHGQQICPRMKLMFVGQGNVGKTTLLKALTGRVDTKTKVMGFVTGKGLRKQTDGIEVDEWSPEEDLNFSTWDFAGQEVYYNTHQFFLSQRSLYLVVFSLAVPLQETNILTWLNSLQVRAPGVSVMLIGTHADKKTMTSHLTDVSEKLRVAIAKWSKLYRKEGRIVIVKPGNDLSFFPVSSIRKTANGLSELKTALLKVARAQPCLKEHVPKLYLSLLEVVKRKRIELAEQPFVDWSTVRSWGVIPDDAALRRACRLLHDWGDIVSFQDGTGVGSLSDLVILDPNWLTLFMTTIVGVGPAPSVGTLAGGPLPFVNSNNSAPSNSAIIPASNLPQLWKNYPPQLYQPLCRLLEKFQVWVKLASGEYLVPCLLQSQPMRNSFDSAPLRAGDHTIGRVYLIPFCPHGFFSHLLLRMWSFCAIGEYWSSGCVVRAKDSQATCLGVVEVRPSATELNPFQAQVRILVRGEKGGPAAASLMTKLVFTLHSFVQDWYGGLSDHITTLLPCVECLRRRRDNPAAPLEHMFAANAFIQGYVEVANMSDTADCPVCKSKVAICDVVPEIVGLAEGQGHYAHEVTEVRSIGVGGFAEVLLGRWMGKEVAVKKLFLNKNADSEGFTLQTFEDFAMEVHMIRQLDHPNVVRLYAAFSRPPAIVLEFVPMGSLDEVLRRTSGPTDWMLVLRMALDIARGLEYLHGFTPRVLHRDLKSPNILVQSLDLSSPVLLKVADLGLSCFYMGNASGKMIENPRWVAPETLETGVYTDKSDVYSFGIICNELVTRRLPFEEIAFDTEIEKAIKAGARPTVDPGTMDKYQKLMCECWARDPSARPTFGSIVMRLLIVIELLLNGGRPSTTTM